MKKKLPVVVLASLCSLLSVGCGGGPSSDGKTRLYVGYFDAGVGRAWIQESIADFEAAYADYSFRTGEKGVKVEVDYDRIGLAGASLLGTIGSKKQTVFITENVAFYDYQAQHKVRSLNNVVKSKGTDGVYTDDKTIEEKMDQSYKDYLTLFEKDNYYAIPYYDGFFGFQYDIDLFEKKNLYFKNINNEPLSDDVDVFNKRFNPSQYFITGPQDQKSLGPDGKTGIEDGIDYSADDGLPSTFNEFYCLEQQMVLQGVIPFIWCTNYYGYLNDAMVALCADIDGEEQFNINNSWTGSATNLVSLDPVTGKVVHDAQTGLPVIADPLTITVDNANSLQTQYGRYKALEFSKKIVSNPNFHVDGSYTHTVAQKCFINKNNEFGDDIGMLIDGDWWEVEGSSNFAESGSDSRLQRKFGLMPMPKVDVATWKLKKGQTYFAEDQSLMFMNANTADDMVEVSEAFLRFLNLDSQMVKFTKNTSMPRPLHYKIEGEDLNKISYYGKELYRIKQRIYSDKCNDSLVTYYPLNLATAKNENTLHKDLWYFNGGGNYSNPMLYFLTHQDVDIETYFEALYSARWPWQPVK